jgi:hypothetical protein
MAMTETEKLIDALKASIQIDLQELVDGRPSPDERRRVIKDHLDLLISDLQTLLKSLD